MLKFLRKQAVIHPCRYQLSLLILLAAAMISLTGCVKREIREDPWNAPRNGVDSNRYDNPIDDK